MYFYPFPVLYKKVLFDYGKCDIICIIAREYLPKGKYLSKYSRWDTYRHPSKSRTQETKDQGSLPRGTPEHPQ